MADGDHGAATLARYAEAQARLEHAGGYDWRERAARTLRGLGFLDKDLDRPLATFSGGELTRASLARALAGDPDLLLLDEPTNHLDVANLEWLEQELQSLDAAVILVAHDRWFLEAVTTRSPRARRRPLAVLPRPLARRGASRRRPAPQPRRRPPSAVGVDIARLERFVERFRYKKSKAKQAQAKLTHIARLEEERADAAGEFELLTRKSKSLGFDFLKPSRSGRTVLEAKDLAIAAGEKDLLGGRDVRHRARRARRPRRAERLGEDHASGDDPRSPRARRRLGQARLRRRGRVLLAARGRARRARQRARLRAASDRAAAAARAVAPRALPLLGLGGAREAGRGPVGRRAAPARARARGRVGRELPRPRRADEPPRPREPRGARGSARRVPRNGSSRLSRPRAAGRSCRAAARDRGARRQLVRRRLGRVRAPSRRAGGTSERAGAAEEAREAEAGAGQARQGRASSSRSRSRSPHARRPSRSSSGELSEDWSNVETLAEHRRARDELQSLLARWEELFERR